MEYNYPKQKNPALYLASLGTQNKYTIHKPKIKITMFVLQVQLHQILLI